MDTGIAAIIVTYNRKDLLLRCIESIQSQMHSVSEIIVVDNASIDGTMKVLEEEFPEVTHLRQSENRGPAGGFAAGIKCGFDHGHDWLWVFNDDARPSTGSLRRLLESAEQLRENGHRIGMLAPVAVDTSNADAVIQWQWQNRNLKRPIPFSINPVPSDILTFNGCLISNELVDVVGIPYSPYFMQMEEHEYALRARRTGFENFVVADRSFENDAAGGSKPWRNYYQTRNHLDMVLRRHPSWKGVFWWIIRQLKFTYGILFVSDRKLERFRMRLLGAFHGAIGKLGRTITPD